MRADLSDLQVQLDELNARLEQQNNELIELQGQVAESNIRLLDALESLSEGFVLLNSDFDVIIINASIGELFGAHDEEFWVPGHKLVRVFERLASHGYQFQADGADLTAIQTFQRIRDERSIAFALTMGDEQFLLCTSRPTSDEGLVLTMQDLSDLKAKENALQANTALLTTMHNSIGQGICAFDALGRLISWNGLFSEMLELPPDFLKEGEYRSGMLRQIIEQSANTDLGVSIANLSADDKPDDGPAALLHGVEMRVGEKHFEISQFEMPGGGNVTTLTDITERKKAEILLIRKATIDALTGLPNRASGLERLEAAVAQADRSERFVAVLYVDLDGFKQVNDTFGHAVGDELIKQAADRMSKSLRRSDTVARLGGDEFLVVAPELKDPRQSNIIAEKLVEELKSPFKIEENEIFVSCSVGITMYPNDGDDPSALLRNADLAMYTSKSSGKNTYRHFSQEMNDGLNRRLELEQAFRVALDEEELFLAYQPIVDLESREPLGAEALIRWERPGIGLVRPDEFIPVIEETSLIVPMGDWVIRTACRDAAGWGKKFKRDIMVSVNVSPRQFRSRELVRVVAAALNDTGLPPACLRIEVTENLLVQSASDITETMSALEALGVGIAMDDFGTGYSSLKYIKELPFKTIKIDKSFVLGVPDNPEDNALTKTIIAMAQSLNLGVIAEGVENDKQLKFLAECGCRLVQGYYFGKPEKEEIFLDFLSESLK